MPDQRSLVFLRGYELMTVCGYCLQNLKTEEKLGTLLIDSNVSVVPNLAVRGREARRPFGAVLAWAPPGAGP